jgi:dihydrofolate synthase/folylpolyglutamate synthase
VECDDPMAASWDYPRALRELWQRSSYERGLISDPFGDKERAERGLTRMRALLRQLGNPQDRVPAVHIAGSKGKGSTAAMIAAAAGQAGYTVGLYTSPHLHRFPERIALNGKPLSDASFAAAAETVFAAAQAIELSAPELGFVSTFDYVTAMGFAAFANAGCDLAVIEVGLGGLYDSTNVIIPRTSVITRIDYEHTAVLGSTLTEIALQKAGIMRAGVPCVVSPQLDEPALAIERAADAIGSPLLLGGRDWIWSGDWQRFAASGPWGRWINFSVGIPGPHQVENACSAIAALHILATSGFHLPEAAFRLGLAHVSWPGRFERHVSRGRQYVLDGAHTPAAAAALVDTWRSELGAGGATVILGMGSDKHPRAFLQALHPLVDRLIATRSDSPRAADPAVLAAAAHELGIAATTAPSVAAAMQAALSEFCPTPVLVTGSLFVVGEAREALGLAEPDEEWRALNAMHQVPQGAP